MAPSTPQADDGMPLSGPKPKVYRSPVVNAAGTVLAIILIVAGLILIGMVRQGGAAAVVAGIGAVIIGAAIEVSVRGSYLAVSPSGIISSYNFKRRSARWNEIRDFEIVDARGQGLASCALAVRLPEGTVKIRGVAGRREYLESVVADLRSLHKSYRQQPGTDR